MQSQKLAFYESNRKHCLYAYFKAVLHQQSKIQNNFK